MCGIAGQLDLGGRGWDGNWAAAMSAAIAHRGPDDAGVWTDPRGGAALAHRRLSILDLSAEGRQPMTSACERFVLTFNGEIYNYKELSAGLGRAGHQFRGSSDTEVMLAAIAEWGIEVALSRFNGMFAFALWDRRERRLHLARDRFGEKPLYYGRFGGVFLFGSELRALRAHPAFNAGIDASALALYLRFSCVPAPRTIFDGVWKLPPAAWLTVDAETGRIGEPVPFWSARDAAMRAASRPFRGSEGQAEDELDRMLRGVVSSRMAADVPLGAFLSGGVDSSIVVAMMQSVSSQAVRTFTIGFDETQFNEAGYAQAVARHLGTEHTELYVTAREALETVPKLPAIYDEPFADSSQLPTYLVSKLARRHVTVALTGDGGDEIFGGYTRYLWADSIWRISAKLPPVLRGWSARMLRAAGGPVFGPLCGLAASAMPFARQLDPGHRLRRLSEVLEAPTMEHLYLGLVSQWQDPSAIVCSASEPQAPFLSQPSSLPDIRDRMMLLDVNGYLPDDILVKMDRASMAVGLEARVPFLDPALFEFAWSLPIGMKIRGRQGKRILRRLLRRYLPERLIDRPKMGFAVPIDAWLRGSLRDWAESLLAEDVLTGDGFFRSRPIRDRWSETLSGADHGQQYLWNVLMFQAWLREARSSRPAPMAFVEAQ